MRRSILLALALGAAWSCGGSPASPTSASTSSGASASTATSTSTSTTPSTPAPTPTPTPSPGAGTSQTFSLSLPIRPGEQANNAYGLVPFGIHIGDHGVDGHPGYDFEFAPGASVYAAAAGVVQSVLPGGFGSTGIQITHQIGTLGYRTIYGVDTVAPGVAAGATIAAGQALGRAPVYTRTIGRTTVTYAMTHFQVDDFTSNAGLTNPNAVAPERWFDAAARSQLDAIWRNATYAQELVEPFLANPRDQSFPVSRVWTRQSGSLAPRLDVTAATPTADSYTYVLRDASGASIESGTITVDAIAKPLPTIDLTPGGSGQPRRGVYDVFERQLQIDYGTPGAARPVSLAGSSTYRTQ